MLTYFIHKITTIETMYRAPDTSKDELLNILRNNNSPHLNTQKFQNVILPQLKKLTDSNPPQNAHAAVNNTVDEGRLNSHRRKQGRLGAYSVLKKNGLRLDHEDFQFGPNMSAI